MKKEVNLAHLEAAIAANGTNVCTTCVLAQAFLTVVGISDGRYVGFNPKEVDAKIMNFCETGNKIASLFDQGINRRDPVMLELRNLLPAEVELED